MNRFVPSSDISLIGEFFFSVSSNYMWLQRLCAAWESGWGTGEMRKKEIFLPCVDKHAEEYVLVVLFLLNFLLKPPFQARRWRMKPDRQHPSKVRGFQLFSNEWIFYKILKNVCLILMKKIVLWKKLENLKYFHKLMTSKTSTRIGFKQDCWIRLYQEENGNLFQLKW